MLFAELTIAFSGVFLCLMACSIFSKLCQIELHLQGLREPASPETKPQGVAALFTPPKFQVFQRKPK